jgi:ubiquinone/menaquinone biosynthesis C-methylase UbiE
MDERVDRTRETYDRVAARFLAHTRDRSPIAFWLERFAQRLGERDMVLDLGAGPGFDSAALRRLGLRAVALDLSLGMLREGLREFPGPRVQADARRLPLPDGCLAGVWASASLLHLSPEDMATALREVRRVLRTAGLLHVSLKSGAGAEWEVERYGEPRWFQYWSAAEIDALLADSGFEVIDSSTDSKFGADWLIRHAICSGTATR